MDNQSAKTPMTDAERLELAKKLDDDLENFINSLEKRKYTEGWPEDRWEEEMEKHPFFMKSAPSPGAELSPLMEGLQQLKYDPNENTPEDLAIAYKEDGNFNFKHKNYRLAIIAYTEAIKVKCKDKEIQGTLYNNRSAAHYFLQNYRSSLRDADVALEFKPDYEKASIRAAHCCYEIGLYEDTIKRCDYLLKKMGPNEDLLKLRSNSLIAKKTKERDSRKKQLSQTKQHEFWQNIKDAALSRGIQIDDNSNDVDYSNLEGLKPSIPQLQDHMVSLDENGRLTWPVVLLYPEYGILEFIQEFHEDIHFQNHLNELFKTSPEWDQDKKYKPSTVNVYMELKGVKLYKVDVFKKLGEILNMQGYVIKDGTPSFIIVAKNSAFEVHFLKQYEL